MAKLSEAQVKALRAAHDGKRMALILGSGQGQGWFYSLPPGITGNTVKALVTRGLLERLGKSWHSKYFRITDAGRAALAASTDATAADTGA